MLLMAKANEKYLKVVSVATREQNFSTFHRTWTSSVIASEKKTMKEKSEIIEKKGDEAVKV
jgi:hypothetical protein